MLGMNLSSLPLAVDGATYGGAANNWLHDLLSPVLQQGARRRAPEGRPAGAGQAGRQALPGLHRECRAWPGLRHIDWIP